jgi:hypothetical protein
MINAATPIKRKKSLCEVKLVSWKLPQCVRIIVENARHTERFIARKICIGRQFTKASPPARELNLPRVFTLSFDLLIPALRRKGDHRQLMRFTAH